MWALANNQNELNVLLSLYLSLSRWADFFRRLVSLPSPSPICFDLSKHCFLLSSRHTNFFLVNYSRVRARVCWFILYIFIFIGNFDRIDRPILFQFIFIFAFVNSSKCCRIYRDVNRRYRARHSFFTIR